MKPIYHDYVREAESMYSNLQGPSYAANGGTYGRNYAADAGLDAGAPVEIPDFDNTFTIVITDTTGAGGNCVIFGGDAWADAVNFGNPANITVVEDEGSGIPGGAGTSAGYPMLLATSARNPVKISGFRIECDTPNQLRQKLVLTRFSYRSKNCSYSIPLTKYFSLYQQQASGRDVFPYAFEVGGDTQLLIPIVAGEDVPITLTFFIRQEVNLGNKLYDMSIHGVSSPGIPFAYGTPFTLAPGANAPMPNALANVPMPSATRRS